MNNELDLYRPKTSLEFEDGSIHFKSCENMKEVEDGSASLVIGSPPFSLTISNRNRQDNFINMFSAFCSESYRILNRNGFFICITSDERIKGSIWAKSSDIIGVANTSFTLYDHIIWKRTNNSLFRIPYSHILIFRNGMSNHINRSEHLNKSFFQKIWDIPDSQVRKFKSGEVFKGATHPRIASLLIERFSRKGELIVNPFTGSGTIVSAAKRLKRRFVGYEVDRKLFKIISDSLKEVRNEIT